MKTFPAIHATNLNGDSLSLPHSPIRAILTFDKNQYENAVKWIKDNPKGLHFPIVSKRFILMKESLYKGLNDHFQDSRELTYPLFVDRIDFFQNIGIENEDFPLILEIDENYTFKLSSL